MTGTTTSHVLLTAAALAMCVGASGCSTSHSGCTFNSECPAGHFCRAGACTSDCTSDAECVAMAGAGAQCTVFGQCIAPDAATADVGTRDDGGASDGGLDAAISPDVGIDASHDAGHDSGPSCVDLLMNGDETDVDCGGATCPACSAGGSCAVDGDCSTHRCAAGTCSGACGLTGLVAHYPFDGDTLDHSGAGNDVTASGVTATTGAFAGAYAFDGVSSAMHVTSSANMSGARSLCAWIDPVSVTGLGQPVFVGGSPGAGDFYGIQSSNEPTAGGSCPGAATEGELYSDHWGYACYEGVAVAPNDAWSFVCFVFDGASTTRFFVDAVEHDWPGGAYDWPLSSLTIGSCTIGGSTTQAAFHGAIDEVTIWNRALDAAEVATLWNDGRSCVP